jgi:hypothetical protein
MGERARRLTVPTVEVKYDHPHFGIEFDWLAVDEAGCIGVFSSAGYGPVPAAVMSEAEALDDAYDRLADLPTVGACTESPQREGRYTDWIEKAARGMYGLDWQVWNGPYERLTVPSRPIAVQDLPEDLRRLSVAGRLIRR